MRKTALIVGACLVLGSCGNATGSKSTDVCTGAAPASGVTADQQIADCTRLVGDTASKGDLQADAYANRAAAYGSKHDYAKAIEDYTLALGLRADDPKILLNRGIAYHHAGDQAKAMADYNRVLQLDPKSAPAYLNRGVAQDQSGRADLAARDYDQAIALNPRYAEAYINRGAMKDMRNDYAGALADYDQAIAFDPKNPIPHTNKGVAYLNSGHVEDAIRELNASIALKPSAYAHIARGHAHSARNELDLAIADYTAAIRLAPNDAEALNDRSIVRARSGDAKGAAEDRAAAVKIDPNIS